MKSAKFEKELNYLLPLVLSYASDYYNLSQYKSTEEVFTKIGQKNFVNKCHEGFKLAQKRIIKLLLEIEEQESKISIKKKDGIRKELYFQKAVLKEIANVIAWTIFKMERTDIKAFLQPNMHDKSLSTSNIQSLIETADYYNKDENKFALINDITSCIGLGDLIILDTQKNTFYLTEVKEGKVNKVILESLKKNNLDIAKEYVHNLKDGKQALSFLKQFKRVLNQHDKSSNAMTYNKTGIGIDLFTGCPKQIIKSNLVDKTFAPELWKALDKFYSQKKETELYFPFDCGFIALIKNPTLAKKWDFQHFILHTILKPKSKCAYAKYKISSNNPSAHKAILKHFNEVRNTTIYSFKNKIVLPTHEPLFFNLPIKQSIDLITNKLAIYVYFDSNEFIRLCKNAHLHPALIDYKNAVQNEQKHIRNSYVNFDGKCLEYGSKNKRIYFFYGYLFRIVYEFQTINSIIKLMQETIKYLTEKDKNIPS